LKRLQQVPHRPEPEEASIPEEFPVTSFPCLPPIGELELDDPFWRYPSGAVEGGARLRVWAASGGTGHLAVVTELGLGVSIADSIEDIWNALRARWHGDLTLLEHYPAAESFPGDGDHLYQVGIGPGREPAWRRVWPVPASSPGRDWLAGWMNRHGHRIMQAAS
jgi:hypothetical protein